MTELTKLNLYGGHLQKYDGYSLRGQTEKKMNQPSIT